jgi:hypothetical protein
MRHPIGGPVYLIGASREAARPFLFGRQYKGRGFPGILQKQRTDGDKRSKDQENYEHHWFFHFRLLQREPVRRAIARQDARFVNRDKAEGWPSKSKRGAGQLKTKAAHS